MISEQLRAKINEATLTKKERLIADYVLDHFPEVCFITSTEIAKQLHISDSSVIRFTRALGYSGFMDFQKNIRKVYTERMNSVPDAITIPSERLRLSIRKLDNNDVIETNFSNVLNNLHSVITKNDVQSFDAASDLIINCINKYIVSSRANSGVGDMLLLLLKHMLPNVHETAHPALNVIDHLCDITENDCLIAISFPRYSKMDLLAAQMAYAAGAKIVLITDKISSPLSQYATQILTVTVDSNTFFNSYVAVTFTIELLASFISKKLGYSNEDKLKNIDKYLSEVGLF